MKTNIDLNAKILRAKPTVLQLDFFSEEVIQNPPWVKKGVDCIIGTDIMFNPQLSVALANVIDKYLAPNGVFYGCSGAHRGVSMIKKTIS